jgi:hypothetical protein
LRYNHLQLDKHACLQAIGVSKRCCFTCHLYLEHCRILHSGSHGRVVPWIPPAGADPEVLQSIYEQLKNQLVAFFEEDQERRRLSRRGPSRSASSERIFDPSELLLWKSAFLKH